MGMSAPPAWWDREGVSIPAARPLPRRSGWALVILLVLWGLGAVAGGFALWSAPDGSGIGFELDLLQATPFTDFLLPGLILFALGLAAVALAVVLGRAVRRGQAPSWMRPLLLLTGFGILAWIVGEIALLWSTVAAMPQSDRTFFYAFWAVYLPLSLAIAALAWRVTRRTST